MKIIRRAFGPPVLIFGGLAAILGLFVYFQLGWEAMTDSFQSDLDLISRQLPNVGAALLIASFVGILLSPTFFSRLMGEESGLKGMAVSTFAGTFTPGGPMTSFPIVLALRQGGAGISPLVSYITAWSTMGIQRVVVWELPLMGIEFVAIRTAASLPLPFIAGLLARLVPWRHAPEPPATVSVENPAEPPPEKP